MSEYSPIRVDIRNIAEAKSIIIDNAEHFWLKKIDWKKYGLTEIDISSDFFDLGYLMTIRNSPHVLPLLVLFQGKSENDNYYWDAIPPTHYLDIGPNCRIGQPKKTIAPSEASLLRDYIVVNLTEALLRTMNTQGHWTKERIIENLFATNPEFKSASYNCYVNLFKIGVTPIFPIKTH